MKILCAVPNRDFDPTEASVPWRRLKDEGHTFTFATPDGTKAAADPHMITGEGLDPWGFLPGLERVALMGRVLRADSAALAAYALMERDAAFARPIRYDALDPAEYDAVLLPGGHWARGMRTYLESEVLQRFVAGCFERDMPIGAICHGVLLAARSVRPSTGKSALYGRKTTALTWRQERFAAGIGRVVRFWDPDYYRTYTEHPGEAVGYRSVQAEVTRALASDEDFLEPDPAHPNFREQTDNRLRDSETDGRPAFVVRDGWYVSARWPGDAHTFAATLATVLREYAATQRVEAD
jgi:putative intracellular protease/amidase